MERLVLKVTTLPEATFPDMAVTLAVKKAAGRIGGLVIWSGFIGKSQLDRQALIWNVLRGGLSADEQLQIGTILTVSTAEMAANEELAAMRQRISGLMRLWKAASRNGLSHTRQVRRGGKNAKCYLGPKTGHDPDFR